MRNNETGEVELVVGNRQLLMGFFIAVLLFSVAFAMGFVVGENSRTAKAQEAAATGSTPPTVADTRPPAASGGSPAVPAPAPVQATEPPPPAQADPQPPEPTTQPAREIREPVREVKPPEPKPRKETPAPVREKPATTESLGLSASVPHEPPAGSYWQVTSTTNPESAQNLLHALRDKGFPAILGPGPNGFTRVLVGPHHENGTLSRSKTELENAGFTKLVLVKH